MTSSTIKILKSFSNEIGEIALRSDNLITFTPNNNVNRTNIDILKKELEILIDWTKDSGPLPFLSDNRSLKQMNSTERRFVQTKLPLFSSRIAIIVNGGLSSYFYNIMSYLNKPEIPMKAFNNKADAISWLKGY